MMGCFWCRLQAEVFPLLDQAEDQATREGLFATLGQALYCCRRGLETTIAGQADLLRDLDRLKRLAKYTAVNGPRGQA